LIASHFYTLANETLKALSFFYLIAIISNLKNPQVATVLNSGPQDNNKEDTQPCRHLEG
jgi:hypothetical protein